MEIKIWDVVKLVVDDDTNSKYQVIGYEVMGEDDKRWIVTNNKETLYKYEQELLVVEVKGKKKVGF